jgi:hypothetical protein
MSGILEDKFLTDTIAVYGKLLEITATNMFYTKTLENIESSLNSLSITDEKKSEMIVLLNSNLATSTISKTMDQATIICDKVSKINLENSLLQKQIDKIENEISINNQTLTKDLVIKDKQAARLDKEIDLIDSQQDESHENVLDRQQKRPIEVANLTKQGTLIDGQISKLNEDKLYVISQKEKMIEQVEHNKIIKAMDSMGDMIGTLGAGGLIINSAMFGVYFRLNKLLTNQDEPTSYSVTKAV